MKTTLGPSLVLVLLFAGCGAGEPPLNGAKRPAWHAGGGMAAMRALALDRSRTRLLGQGARFRPSAIGSLARAGVSIGWLRCGAPGGHPYGVHIELFAAGHEVIVPAGIGIAPPQRRVGASVEGGRCAYPVRTVDPTGVILVDRPPTVRATPTIGDLFEIWGQALGRHRLAGFTAPATDALAVFLDGRRVLGSPGAIPLSRHAQIVLELGPHVQPHPSYRFPPGL